LRLYQGIMAMLTGNLTTDVNDDFWINAKKADSSNGKTAFFVFNKQIA
jgi:hypothetical protein